MICVCGGVGREDDCVSEASWGGVCWRCAARGIRGFGDCAWVLRTRRRKGGRGDVLNMMVTLEKDSIKRREKENGNRC